MAAGLTGFDGTTQTAREISGGLRRLVRAGRVVLVSDAVTSYLGAIGFEPGVVVAAGTGVIALAGDTEGNFVRGNGWGYVLGDDGGGYYVGRRGLAAALRRHDGRGGSEDLLRRAEAVYGPPEAIKGRVYAADNPPGVVAGFAPEVAEAARAGDPEAAEIWADAAREVALTATACLGRVFAPDAPVTVSWTGSLFDARDLMLEPFRRHVEESWPAARLFPPTGDAIEGAGLLCAPRASSMFAPLIHVSGH